MSWYLIIIAIVSVYSGVAIEVKKIDFYDKQACEVAASLIKQDTDVAHIKAVCVLDYTAPEE